MPNGQIAGRDAVTAVTVGPAPPPAAAAAVAAAVVAADDAAAVAAERTTSWRPRARSLLHGRRVHWTQKHRTHPVAARQTGEENLPAVQNLSHPVSFVQRTQARTHTRERMYNILFVVPVFSVCNRRGIRISPHPARPIRSHVAGYPSAAATPPTSDPAALCRRDVNEPPNDGGRQQQ